MTVRTNAVLTGSLFLAQVPQEMSLPQAGRIAGGSLLVTTLLAPPAFFGIFPTLIVRSDPALTVTNIQAHQGLFLVGFGCYFLTFVADIVLAWGLSVFFQPASPRLSQLTAWFRVAYATTAFSAIFKLPTVLRLVRNPEYATAFGATQLQAQVQVLLTSFRVEWSCSMLVFTVHLALLSALAWRSGYVPRVIGVLLAITALGYLVDTLRPYLFSNVALSYLFVTFFGEIVFMVWLLVRGSRVVIGSHAAPSGVARS